MTEKLRISWENLKSDFLHPKKNNKKSPQIKGFHCFLDFKESLFFNKFLGGSSKSVSNFD